MLITAAHQPTSTFPRWAHKPQGRWGEPATPLKDEGWRPGGEATTRGHAGDRASQPPGDPQLPAQDGPGSRWKGKPGCWISLPPPAPSEAEQQTTPWRESSCSRGLPFRGRLKGAPTHPATPGSDGEGAGSPGPRGARSDLGSGPGRATTGCSPLCARGSHPRWGSPGRHLDG